MFISIVFDCVLTCASYVLSQDFFSFLTRDQSRDSSLGSFRYSSVYFISCSGIFNPASIITTTVFSNRCAEERPSTAPGEGACEWSPEGLYDKSVSLIPNAVEILKLVKKINNRTPLGRHPGLEL